MKHTARVAFYASITGFILGIGLERGEWGAVFIALPLGLVVVAGILLADEIMGEPR